MNINLSLSPLDYHEKEVIKLVAIELTKTSSFRLDNLMLQLFDAGLTMNIFSLAEIDTILMSRPYLAKLCTDYGVLLEFVDSKYIFCGPDIITELIENSLKCNLINEDRAINLIERYRGFYSTSKLLDAFGSITFTGVNLKYINRIKLLDD